MNKGLLIAGLALGIYIITSKKTNNQEDIANKKAYIASWAQVNGQFTVLSVLNNLTDAEVIDVYNLVFQYQANILLVPAGALKNRLMAISQKYNIFT